MNVDEDEEEEDEEKQKTLGVGGSVLYTMDSQSNS